MIRRLLLCLCLVLPALTAGAQGRASTAGTTDPQPAQRDTTRQRADTLKKVDIRVRNYDPQAMQDLKPFRQDFSSDIVRVLYIDESDRVGGFQQTLGQYGKPYRRYELGAPAHWLDSQHFTNPITGEEDIYLLNPHREVRYWDTRTPFVNLWYTQGKQELTQMEATVSRNISPWVNATVHFRRRRFDGPYINHFTDHYNMYASFRGRLPGDRLHFFGHILFNHLNDEIHGGVNSDQEFDAQFDKRSELVNLTQTLYYRKQRGLYFRPTYLLVRDTAHTAHRAALFGTLLRDEFLQEYRDTITGDFFTADSSVNVLPTYPSIDSGYRSFWEQIWVRRWYTSAGGSYRFQQGALNTGHSLEYQQEVRTYSRQGRDITQFIARPVLRGDLTYDTKPFVIKGNYEWYRAQNTLYKGEDYLRIGGSLGLPGEKLDYSLKEAGPDWKPRDSVIVPHFRRPFTVFAEFLTWDRNPSFQNTYWKPYVGNVRPIDSTLRNTLLTHYRLGARWQGADQKVSQHHNIVEGHYVQATLFSSRTARAIWFGPGLSLHQAANGSVVNFTGAELKFRGRLGRFALENTAVYQIGSSRDSLLERYVIAAQPAWYGKAGIYYENKDLSIAAILRAGIEYVYQDKFYGYAFDPANQIFYGQDALELPAFGRFDVVFSTQIKRAYVFLRAVNVADGLLAKGYYTTPWYPMLDRTIMFGFHWSFYD